MTSIIKYLLFLVLVIIFSCDRSALSVNCSGCTKDEPLTAEISISVSPVSDINYQEVVVKVYSGNLEDSILLSTYNVTTAGTDLVKSVTLNKRYTYTATYLLNGMNYTTVDAIFPRTKYEPSACNDPCYYSYDTKVNLKLKYSK
jgi:hypothetical protein